MAEEHIYPNLEEDRGTHQSRGNYRRENGIERLKNHQGKVESNGVLVV